MPNQQDFVLNLVAELDEGSVQSDAARIATSITQTIERAFEGLGQKIAENIMKGVQSGASGIGALVDPRGNPLGGSPPTGAVGPVTPGAPPPSAPAMPNPLQSFSGGFQSFPGYLDIHSMPSQAASAIRRQIQSDILGGGGGGGNVGYESDPQALSTDVAYQRAKQIKAMRDAGIKVDLSDEERDMFGRAKSAGSESLMANKESQSRLGDEIIKLNQHIVDLQKEMNESNRLSHDERQKRGLNEPEQIKAQQDTEKAKLERLKQEIGQIANVSGTEAGRLKDITGVLNGGGGGFDMGRALGVAAPIAMGMARLPGMLRASDVAGTDTANLEGRALGGGDIERLMAVRNLGGMGSLTGRAGMETLGIGAASLLGAGASFMAGGPMGMMAGTGLALNGMNNIVGFEGARRGRIEEMIGSEMNKNQELYGMSRTGREAAMGSIVNAQGMGDIGLAPFLTGSTGRGALSRARDTASQTYQVEDYISTLYGGKQVTDEQRSARAANLSAMDKTLKSMSPDLEIDGQSYSRYGISQGLVGPGQVSGILNNVARGMGGSFGGAPLVQNSGMMRNILDTQAAGLGNTADILGTMQGASDPNRNQRGENAQMLKDLFEDAVSGGLDKARVGQALMVVAQQNQGMGGASMMANDFRSQMGAAQRVFGEGGVEGAEFSLTNRVMKGLEAGGRGDSGLMAMGGQKGAAAFMKKNGIKGGYFDEVTLQQFAGDPAGLKRFFKENGKDISDEEASAKSAELQQDIQGGAYNVMKDAMGGKAARIAMAKATGSTTLSDMYGSGDIANLVSGGNQLVPRTTQDLGIAGHHNSKISTTTSMIQKNQEATGMAQAQALAAVDSEKISAGLVTLGTNIKEVNDAFEKLIDRAEQVLQGQVNTNGYSGFGSSYLSTVNRGASTKAKPKGY